MCMYLLHLLLQRSFSVSGSCRLGEQLYHRRYQNASQQRVITSAHRGRKRWSIVCVSHSRLSGHMRTLSLGSGGWDSEGGWAHLRPIPYTPSWSYEERGERRRGDRLRERQWYMTNV